MAAEGRASPRFATLPQYGKETPRLDLPRIGEAFSQ